MKISYIPAGIPFLEALADHVLREKDPLRLASCQIFLPTQESCKALKQVFLKKNKGSALLLPRIQALAHLNADDMVLQGGSADLLKGKISERRRHLLLTNLIATHRALSTEQAALLANTLLQFLDDLAREGIALDAVDFDHLVASDHALHWQITGDFLKLIQQEWPKSLAAENTLEPYAAENFMLDEQARLWAANPPQHPVIIAGSRGSRPATARLIQQVAALSQGHIILQGLVPSDCMEDLSPTHPQADLKKLLNFLEVSPHRVHRLGTLPDHQPSRILESAFQYTPAPMETIRDISVAECASSQQEAEVIALALRQVLETPDETGILITQDRNLARRVRMALQRWRVDIHGSKIPLSQTPLGSLVVLTAQWIQPNFDLGIFLATLKHPLVHKDSIDQLEIEIIRKGAWSWDLIIQKSKGTTLEPFVQELGHLMQACQDLAKAPHVSFEKVMGQHQQVLTYLLDTGLWPAVEYAAEMQTFWEDLQQASCDLTISTGADYAKLLARYLEYATCKAYTHDRIQILELMEARLLHANLVILGGLNQGSWPKNLPADPWFNRATRQKLGLTPPEERIGISAHDFVQAGAASEILLTRSVRVEGTPTVPSSFLVKVQTWLQQQGHTLPVAQDLLDWSVSLLESRMPMAAPAPKPPVGMRPHALSISDMATWMQNPYGIYAKKVLDLRPLPSPFENNSALTFGTMVHEVLQKILPLVQAKADNIAETTETIWHQYENQFIPHERIFWHWRLQKIVQWFVSLPDNLQGQTSYAEVWGQIKIGDFTIEGKIDRIDIQQGNAHVIDYKTGVLPSTGFVKYGISPQLLLEAWMVQEGLMQDVPKTPVASASLWRLPMGWQNDTRITLDGENLDMFLVQLQEKVGRLIALFHNPDTPYLCHPRGKICPSPYDHLARFQEWSTQDSTQDSTHE